MAIRHVIRFFMVLLFFSASCAFSGADGIYKNEFKKSVLDNGTVIVSDYIPDSPLVTIQIRVLSGLSNEGKYAGSGISHFLEHLLFKNTNDKNSQQIRETIKEMGGFVNGSTGLDSAEYHINVPVERFEEAMDLLIKMVMEPVFSSEDFETERNVILKEIRLHEDDPESRLIRLLFDEGYSESVYKYPIIGYEEVFKKLTPDDLREYHSAVYTPERMVLGITGGVPSEKALKTAEDKLKGYDRKFFWMAPFSPEPVQMSEKITMLPSDVTVAYITVGFHATSLYSPYLYAGDILSIILGVGNDSRLYRELVEEKNILYSISCQNYTPRYPGMLIITGVCAPDKIQEAREGIFSVVESLKNVKIRETEMEKAKNFVISSYVRSHERIKTVNSSITSSCIFTGDPDFFEKYVDEIRKTGPEQVKAFAEKFLTRKNSTTAVLKPESDPVDEETAVVSGTEEESRSMVLKNGLRINIIKRGRLPLVSVTYACSGGLRAENGKDNGISNLVSFLMLKGTKKRREEAIIPEIERMGGSITPFSGMNSIGLSMSLMSDNLDKGMDIFEDVIKNADFPMESIEKEKGRVIAAIKEEEKDVFENGMFNVRKILFSGHPYAMRILGGVQAVDSLTREELRDFYNKHFIPKGSVLTITGDISPETVIADITKRFSAWEREGEPVLETLIEPLPAVRETTMYTAKKQSVVFMGFQGVKITDRRKYALAVISAVLSGSDGILFYSAREKEGITYAAGAVSVPQVDTGYFVLYVATTKENIEKAEETMKEAVCKIVRGEVSDKEIESSKKRIITQHAYSLEANSDISMTVALDDLYGLGYEDYKRFPVEIASLTKQDIVESAGEILGSEEYALVIVQSTR
ncbi:MAG: pitrilysin family protein [Candidatus Omnitrophota bacterium]